MILFLAMLLKLIWSFMHVFSIHLARFSHVDHWSFICIILKRQWITAAWTDTDFDYTNSNINRIYMYLHRECHFLLTLTCAVICGVLLVCVFAFLALMWFYLFDCLFNVTSSPSVCTRSPQSPHILTTQETGKHSGKTPKPPTLVSLLLSLCLSSFPCISLDHSLMTYSKAWLWKDRKWG